MTALLRNLIHLLAFVGITLVYTGSAQSTTETQSQCSTGFPPASLLQPLANLSELIPENRDGGGVQVIAPGMRFNCYGRITEWNALLTIDEAFSSLSHQIQLQVWRPSTETFDLVGSNTLEMFPTGGVTLMSDENSTITFLSISISEAIAQDTQIFFEPGDVLGWYSPQRFATLSPGFGVALQRDGSVRPDLLTSFTDGVPCEMYTCDDAVQQLTGALPLIRMEIEMMNPNSANSTPNAICISSPPPSSCIVSTTQPTTSPPTPTLPTSITEADTTVYIIAGVVPGGLLIIIFVVIGVLMMCMGCKTCGRKITKSETTNPTYATYANPDDFIHLDQPPSKSPLQNGMFFNNTGDSPVPNTPIGFSEELNRSRPEDMFDGHNYASTYQINGQNHIYHELVKTPEPPPLPHRASFVSTGSLKGRGSTRFSIQSITQFPYTMPNTPAPSCPYLEAVPSVPNLDRPQTPQDSPPSSASAVSESGLTMRKLFHALDEEGFRVPTAEERALYDDTKAEEIYSKLQRPHSTSKSRNSRDNTFFEQSEIYWEPSYSSSELFNQLARRKYREIRRSNIRSLEALGGGHFSSVHKGIWEVPGGCIEVAVKTLKSNASEKDKVKFLQEAAIMGQFLHPNVIKLHGVVTVGEPVMIVLEIMPKGDLKNFVRKLRSKPKPDDLAKTFLRFGREVAFGMNYLSNKGYVHRDLAARNVLLTEDLTCKIADFGMARDLDVDNIYQSQGGKIPLKWTAPEGLKHRQYSSASDVWSYGMLLFEIWTLGRKPYEGISTDELMNFMDAFHCQAPPPGTPREVYRLMVQCWHPVPTERPRFSEVCNYLNSTDEVLLNWSSSDKAVGPRVTELGAPLSEGVDLYLDLQYMYSAPRDRLGSTVSITAV